MLPSVICLIMKPFLQLGLLAFTSTTHNGVISTTFHNETGERKKWHVLWCRYQSENFSVWKLIGQRVRLYRTDSKIHASHDHTTARKLSAWQDIISSWRHIWGNGHKNIERSSDTSLKQHSYTYVQGHGAGRCQSFLHWRSRWVIWPQCVQFFHESSFHTATLPSKHQFFDHHRAGRTLYWAWIRKSRRKQSHPL